MPKKSKQQQPVASEKMQTRAAANTINFLYRCNESGQKPWQLTVPMRSWVASQDGYREFGSLQQAHATATGSQPRQSK